MEPNIESRTKRTLIRCPICNKPIGERENNKWWFLRYGGGEAEKVPIEIDQNTPSGSYRVKCPDKGCKGGHIFAWINEEIIINDNLTIKKGK
jgi:ssDNA-binding Zn-finger/Zn-ribbon topoisomerase 1